MRIDPDLHGFFADLRQRGLRVGVEEAMRIRYVLARLDEARKAGENGTAATILKPTIGSLIAKSAAQKQAFDEAYGNWAEQIECALLAPRNAGPMDTQRPSRSSSERRGSAVLQQEHPTDTPKGYRAPPLRRLLARVLRRPASRRDVVVAGLVFFLVIALASIFTLARTRHRASPPAMTPPVASQPSVPSQPTESTKASATEALSASVPALPASAPAVGMSTSATAQHQEPPKAVDPGPTALDRSPTNPAQKIDNAFPRFPNGAPVLADQYESWEEELIPQNPVVHTQPRSPWPFVALSLACLVSAVWLHLRYGRRSWLPDAVAAPRGAGLPWVAPTVPVPPRGPAMRLLDAADRETLVWGVGRFISEVRTNILNVSTTVTATAASGGIPALRFLPARREREIWLWIDRSVGATVAGAERTLERLADEVARTLRGAGLVVERAYFHGVPDELWSDGNQRFTPLEVEERRDTALVAILTDGRLLAQRHGEETQRQRIEALLRVLSGFPNLAFVDSGCGMNGLVHHLAKHGLSLIGPSQLATFLGGSRRPSASPSWREPAAPHSKSQAYMSWMACLALAPFPIQEELAFALRESLGLGGSVWTIETIRPLLQTHGEWLDWDRRGQHKLRAQFLGWLRESSTQGGRLLSESLLCRALAFWKRQLDEENQRHQARRTQQPKSRASDEREANASQVSVQRESNLGWQDSPAALRLRMDRALLELWDEPSAAIRTLYQLHGSTRVPGPLQALVRGRLRQLGARDCPHGDRAVILPWLYADRSDTERVMLQELGFGADHCPLRRRESLTTPGRYCVALGCAIALTAIGAIGGVVRATQRFETTTEIPAKRSWQVVKRPCREETKGLGEVWRCGTTPRKLQPQGWSEKSEAMLVEASPDDFDAQALAAALIDGGTVDRVLWVQDWSSLDQAPGAGASDLNRLVLDAISGDAASSQGSSTPDGTTTTVFAESWAYLLGRLGFDGTQAASDVWPHVTHQLDTLQIRGVGPGPIEMVWVPRGEFLMGSIASDKDAAADEKPTHRVKVSGFWMGKREVSNADYRRIDLTHEGEDSLPVTNVNWEEARTFCETLGLALPTEAEWEYAARGRDGRLYPWGNQLPDGQRAVYASPSRTGPDPVDSHPEGAGPFGTLQQAGNVWEWVADCYDEKTYEKLQRRPGKQAVQDPLVDKKDCQLRVLRGGSWYYEPPYMRSASRVRYVPGSRVRGVGFRCVRGSRRQPVAL